MKLYAQLAVAALLATGGIASIGCTVHEHGPAVVFREPPVGYVYENDYYRGGHWDGDYWAWRDRDGRLFRERREIREQRAHDFAEREHREHR